MFRFYAVVLCGQGAERHDEANRLIFMIFLNCECTKALPCSDGEFLCLTGFSPCSLSESNSVYSQLMEHAVHTTCSLSLASVSSL